MASDDTTSSGRIKKPRTDPVQVSFIIEKSLKEEVREAAKAHKRTQSEQFEQCIIDGVRLQDVIKEVSAHFKRSFGNDDVGYYETKPDADQCIEIIRNAVRRVLRETDDENGAGESAE